MKSKLLNSSFTAMAAALIFGSSAGYAAITNTNATPVMNSSSGTTGQTGTLNPTNNTLNQTQTTPQTTLINNGQSNTTGTGQLQPGLGGTPPSQLNNSPTEVT